MPCRSGSSGRRCWIARRRLLVGRRQSSTLWRPSPAAGTIVRWTTSDRQRGDAGAGRQARQAGRRWLRARRRPAAHRRRPACSPTPSGRPATRRCSRAASTPPTASRAPPSPQTSAPAPTRARTACRDAEIVRRLAVLYARGLKAGDPIGRLRIPRIDLNRLVQQGVGGRTAWTRGGDIALLRNGPVHYARHAAAGGRRALRRRRPPHDLRRAVLQARQAAPGRPHLRRHALRAASATRSPRRRSCCPTDIGVLADRGYGAGAHHLHAALQRQPPPDRVGDSWSRRGRSRRPRAADALHGSAGRAQPAAPPGNGGRSAALPPSSMTRTRSPASPPGIPRAARRTARRRQGHRAQDRRSPGGPWS